MATFLGNPVTFTGSQLQVGEMAHDFSLITPALEKTLLKGSTMPSCSQTTTTIPSGKHTAS